MDIKVGDGVLTVNGRVHENYKYVYKEKQLFEVVLGSEYRALIDDCAVKYTKDGLNIKHARRKASGDLLGCCPRKALKVFNQCMFKAFLEKYDKELLMKFCYSARTKSFSRNIVLFARCYEKLSQAKKDGILNISPFILKYNLCPKELKEKTGTNWKVLSKNSFYRNQLLSSLPLQRIGEFIDVPSSLLNVMRPRHNEGDVLKVIAREFKGSYKYCHKWIEFYDLIHDVANMCIRNGVRMNYTWSLRRLEEEHTRLIKLENSRRCSDEEYAWYKDIPDRVKYLGNGRFSARLLKSSAEIQQEGVEMRHCVGIYAVESSKAAYLVYSVSNIDSDTEVKSSTVGFLVRRTGDISLSQHYGKCNATVIDNEETGIVNSLCDELKRKDIKNYFKELHSRKE